jgi:ABC-2 type transport system ATP-binding protein
MSAHRPAPPVIVDDLHKAYGAVRAVTGVSWSARAGAVTAVLGSNGAGKTTTLECLEGLQRPDRGTVRVLGSDPWRAGPEHRARVGVMLQDGGLPNTRAAGDVLEYLASLYSDPVEPRRLMQLLGITEFAGRTVRRLSGGQRQRVALAAALVGRPEVAFLDEPTAGLDPHARRDVWDVISALVREDCCVVVTTHSFEEAERLADDIVIMDHGGVVAHGPIAAVTDEATLEDAFFRMTRPRQDGASG